MENLNTIILVVVFNAVMLSISLYFIFVITTKVKDIEQIVSNTYAPSEEEIAEKRAILDAEKRDAEQTAKLDKEAQNIGKGFS